MPADLHDVHPELSVLTSHQIQFPGGTDPALVRTKLVTEYIAELGKVVAATDRTRPARWDAVVLSGQQQVGIGVTQVSGERLATPQVSERCPPL